MTVANEKLYLTEPLILIFKRCLLSLIQPCLRWAAIIYSFQWYQVS